MYELGLVQAEGCPRERARESEKLEIDVLIAKVAIIYFQPGNAYFLDSKCGKSARWAA